MNFGEEFSIIDFVSMLSFIIGLENLNLNKIQVNDIMREMQNNQNKMLSKIIEQNEQIIKMLKEIDRK
jgi:hypothetical protein|nr:MAG TPA: hypothetical protein [Bacteriophage sp.]